MGQTKDDAQDDQDKDRQPKRDMDVLHEPLIGRVVEKHLIHDPAQRDLEENQHSDDSVQPDGAARVPALQQGRRDRPFA